MTWGEATKNAVAALASQPILLVIVILNMVFAMSAGYFLSKLVDRYSETHRYMLERCLPDK